MLVGNCPVALNWVYTLSASWAFRITFSPLLVTASAAVNIILAFSSWAISGWRVAAIDNACWKSLVYQLTPDRSSRLNAVFTSDAIAREIISSVLGDGCSIIPLGTPRLLSAARARIFNLWAMTRLLFARV